MVESVYFLEYQLKGVILSDKEKITSWVSICYLIEAFIKCQLAKPDSYQWDSDMKNQ